MAVDTRNKRFSLLGFGRGFFGATPNPDGGFAIAADRAQLAYLYPGIALDEPAASSNASFSTLILSPVWGLVRSPITGA